MEITIKIKISSSEKRKKTEEEKINDINDSYYEYECTTNDGVDRDDDEPPPKIAIFNPSVFEIREE